MKTANLKRTLAAAAFAAVSLGAAPALAGKADDTLNMAFQFPMSTVDAYMDFKPEVEMLSPAVFDGLVVYDEGAHKFQPLLAESWEQVSDKLWRFKLRKDVKWHDGEPFNADDVVYTFKWIIAPETRIRTKASFRWIADVKKTDDYTVEFATTGPTPNILARLAYGAHILPEHVHGPLKDKQAFRNNPVGTGMYKVESLGKNGELVLKRNDAFNHGGAAKPKPSIGTVKIRSVPDLGAQTAALLAGKLDFVRNLSFEEAQAIAADPRYAVTISQSLSYMYMQIDVTGQSGVKPLTDPRVRQAIMMAVDRDVLARARTGGKKIDRVPGHLCWDFQESCSHTVPLPAYDPKKAKALLAEAGVATGLSVKLHTFNSTKDFAEIVAGFLNKVGIKAEVVAQTFAAWRKSQAAGEFQVLIGAWNAGKSPDGVLSMSLFFNSDGRDYYRNAEITKLNKSLATMPIGKERADTVAKILDASVRDGYMIPLTGLPVVFLHNAGLKIHPNRNIPYTVYLHDFSWSD